MDYQSLIAQIARTKEEAQQKAQRVNILDSLKVSDDEYFQYFQSQQLAREAGTNRDQAAQSEARRHQLNQDRQRNLQTSESKYILSSPPSSISIFLQTYLSSYHLYSIFSGLQNQINGCNQEISKS